MAFIIPEAESQPSPAVYLGPPVPHTYEAPAQSNDGLLSFESQLPSGYLSFPLLIKHRAKKHMPETSTHCPPGSLAPACRPFHCTRAARVGGLCPEAVPGQLGQLYPKRDINFLGSPRSK